MTDALINLLSTESCYTLVYLSLTSEPLPIHVDLPVGLPGDGNVVEITIVVFGVGSSQEQLTTGFCVRVPDHTEHKP